MPEGKTQQYIELAQKLQISDVTDGIPSWLPTANYFLDILPALLFECKIHPYEIVGVLYKTDITPSSIEIMDAKSCEWSIESDVWREQLYKVPFIKGCTTEVYPLWYPGTPFQVVSDIPLCRYCGYELRIEKDGTSEQAFCEQCRKAYANLKVGRDGTKLVELVGHKKPLAIW